MTRRVAPVVLLLLATASGCTSSETTSTTVAVPTEIAVNPLDFRGDVSCSVNDGAMKSYVMTLFHHEDALDDSPFSIGSSVPTPCSLDAGFRSVIRIDQRYSADIDAYDLPVSMLVPFGDASSGARQMRRADDGEIVVPRWTSHCGGSAASAVRAIGSTRVYVRPCDPLLDAAPSDTRLVVPPQAVLGDDPCAVADSYDIVFESGNLPDASGIACDASDGASFEATADTDYRIYATARIDNKLHGSECLATGRQGEAVTPSCGELSALGRVRLSPDVSACPLGSFYDVVDAASGALNALPLACGASAQIGPFEPGVKLFEIEVYDADGGPIEGGQSCSASVQPGKLVTATCL